MCNAVYFDLDGTLADLYSVDNWEYKLNHEDVSPYAEAAPLCNMEELHEIICDLQAVGVTVGVISWLAMHSNKEYDKATRRAKKEWLKKYLPTIDEIHLVKYGTPKQRIPKVKQNAILVDDNAEIRGKWSRGDTINPVCEDIVEELRQVLTTMAV